MRNGQPFVMESVDKKNLHIFVVDILLSRFMCKLDIVDHSLKRKEEPQGHADPLGLLDVIIGIGGGVQYMH